MEDNKPQGNEGEIDMKKVLEEVAQLKAGLTNAVGELKELRQTKASIEAERDALKAAANGNNGGDSNTGEALEAVKQFLSQKEKDQAEKNRQQAEAKFKNKYKEFHPENDPGGLKFEALKGKLSRFSTGNLSSEDDFVGVMEDAYTLLNPAKKATQGGDHNPYASTTSQSGSGPRQADSDNLSYKETTVIQRLGWTKEQFLKQKAKRPSYVAQLLAHMD